jgi:hypothetical protein
LIPFYIISNYPSFGYSIESNSLTGSSNFVLTLNLINGGGWIAGASNDNGGNGYAFYVYINVLGGS